MNLHTSILLCFVSVLKLCNSKSVKSDLVFVIDDTASMTEEIDGVKEATNDIFDAVYNSKDSQIENFILYTFNDPDTQLRTITRDRENFKTNLAAITTHSYNNNEYPEMALTGIEGALLVSQAGCYIYVFTDAAAKDDYLLDRVKSLAIKKSCQIVFVLSGLDGVSEDYHTYHVYNALADATSGQIFLLQKSDIADLLNYVKETIKEKRTVMVDKKFPPGYGHEFTYTVDEFINDVIISVSGLNANVSVKDHKGSVPLTERVVDKKEVTIIKIDTPSSGVYTAEVGSESKTAVVVSGSTKIDFHYGFSSFMPSSINDTSTKPLPDGESILSIQIYVKGGNAVLNTVKLLDTDEKVIQEFPLELIDDKEKFYATNLFDAPRTLFRIMITGLDAATNTSFTRTSPTMIERQKPELEIMTNIAPTVSIEGEPKINVEFLNSLILKCKVHGYPKPEIVWEERDTGIVLPSTVLAVEPPYDYISILTLEKINKNCTYLCKARNDYGLITGQIDIKTIEKIFFKELEIPKDITVEYKKKSSVTCKIETNPPVKIIWSRNGLELSSDTYIEISDDGTKLTITNMQPILRGHYTCRTIGKLGKKDVSFDVRISGADKPKLDKSIKSMNVIKGNYINIPCRVIKGRPTPKVIWSFREKSKKKFFPLKTTGEVHRTKKGGSYKCIAMSTMGRDEHRIDLTVQYRPTIKKDLKLYNAKKGNDVTINCKVDGSPVPHVQWLKNGHNLTITRTTKLFKDHTLRLKVCLEDSGIYECIATNILGTVKRSVQVNVFVPVTIEPPEESTVEVMVGEKALLPCQANGFPKPVINWVYHDTDTKELKNLTYRGSTLDLSHIQLYEQGYYTCVASNFMGSRKIAYLIKVNAPPMIENTYIDKTFRGVKGDVVLKIVCRAKGHPKPDITWTKEGRTIALGTPYYDKDADGTLIIKNLDIYAEGTYLCEAKNSFGRDTKFYDVMVDTYPRPGPPKVTRLEEEGSITHVLCNLPHGLTDSLLWFKGDKYISRGELTLRNIKQSDSGMYTCRVSNFFSSRSETTNIKVGFKPKFDSDAEEIIDIEEGWETSLACDAAAYPPPQVFWFHNNKKLDNTNMNHNFIMQFSNRGIYSCNITNDFGSIFRIFHLRPTDCLIDIKKDISSFHPVMVSPLTYKWPSFEITDGLIRIPRGKEISLVCPTSFTHFPKRYITAYCVDQSNFQINGRTQIYSEIKCTKEIKPVVKWTNAPCYTGDTEWIIIGMPGLSTTITIFEVCFDKGNKVPLYTKQNLDGFLAEVEPEHPTWMINELPFNFNDMYDCDTQSPEISRILLKWFHKKDKCCFKKRQLVNSRDVAPGVAQLSTYNYLNVVPHWSSCGSKNWDEVEKRLRTLAKSIKNPLRVWTGTTGDLKMLSSKRSLVKIWIRDSSRRKQPVPQYLWKVVQYPDTRSSLAIIQVNMPDLSSTQVSEYVLCTDICNNVRWMKNPEWHDVTKGYTYCCTLAEFEKVFSNERAFDRGHNRVLYDIRE